MSERKIQLLRAPSSRDGAATSPPRVASGAGALEAGPQPPAERSSSSASPLAAEPTAAARTGSLPLTAPRTGSLPPTAPRAGSLPPTAPRAGSLPPRATSGSPPPESAAGVWREVLLRLDDEALHHAFIRACLAEGRMTFALECYRTLERLRPGDPIAARYLAQVATAIEVGALGVPRGGHDPHERRLRRALQVLMALVIGILGMLALYGLIRFAAVALGP